MLAFVALMTLVDVPAPVTPKKPVVDERFGDKVTDDYRWLEDWADPAVQKWSEAQNARARKILDALPARAAIEKRVTQLLSFESPAYRDVMPRGGLFFSLKQQPPKQQPFLVVAATLDDVKGERVVVDPNTLDGSGGTSIDFYAPSPDGMLLAVSLSKGGSESGSVHIFDVATGSERAGDVVVRANSGTAGGTLAWRGDSAGFWYTRHPVGKPEDDGFFQQVAFHKLGESVDTVELADGLERTAENFLDASDDGRFVLDLVQKGDGGEFELWLRSSAKAAHWRKVAHYDDRVVAARFGKDGTVWLLSRKDAGRGKILRLQPTAASMESAHLVVAEGKATIDAFEVTASRLFLVQQLGGPSQVELTDLAGAPAGTVAIPAVSSVAGLVRAGDGDVVVFQNQSFTSPPAWFMANASGAVTKTALVQEAPASMADVVVTRAEAVSKDGTKIPYTIVTTSSAQRGDAPTLLTGYGGFSVAITPAFSKLTRAWLDQGGVFVVANLRGGSELGEAWHQAGMKRNKQHVFDDFIAVAEELVKTKVTKPERLAIQGGSNGGLLMGAALTQVPNLFRVVVAQVGYFDMLRYETKPNGAFNNTEYGTVADNDDYQALKKYSPYQAVKDGVKYPPTLFLTGANDPRVDPLHSRKMVARLQAAGATAILRTSGGTGHGGGTPLSAKIAESVDIYAFLFHELGVSYR